MAQDLGSYLDPNGDDGAARRAHRVAPGRKTLTMALMGAATAPIQRKRDLAMPSGAREIELPTGGAPLPDLVRGDMERSFGADFGGVRVHQGDVAPQLGAVAFATGDDLHFAPGAYDPVSTSGRSLLGHELAHVVQQREGRVAAPGQGKGMPINADDGLEREADAWGDAAARGEIVRQGPFLGGRATGPIQRKTTVGLIKDVATSSMTREVLQSLITQHKLEMFAETIENVAFWWFDPKLSSALSTLKDMILSEGLRASLTYLASYVTPVLGWLNTLRGIVKLLPETVQTVLGYGLGRGFTGMLGYIISQPRAEAITSAIFIDTNLDAAIAWVTQAMNDLIYHPASTLYKMVWGSFGKPALQTDAPSLGAYGAERAFEAVVGEAPARDRAPARQDEQAPREPEEVAAPLVKKDLKYLWLELDKPSLKRFQHKDQASGGLVLPFKFGVNLFGTQLATRKPTMIELPWSGGFTIAVQDLAIDNPPSLPPVFTIGGILLPTVVVNDGGLEAFECKISKVGLADGAVNLPEVSASYHKGKGLTFKGALAATILGTPVEGTGELALDGDGGFEAAELGFKAPAKIDVVPDVLSFANPAIRGRVEKGGKIDIGLASDLESAFGIFRLAMTRAHVEYKKGDGHQFSGGIDALTLRIGQHVTLGARNVIVDRNGLSVGEASLLYQHDPDAPDRAKNELTTIGGIDPSLLSFTGLKSLTIGGKVTGLKIGPGAKIQAESAQLASGGKSDEPASDGPAKKPLLQGPGFSVDSVEPVLSKIGAKVFGVEAMLDIENRRGTITGAASYKPPIPTFQAAFPIVPGLEAYASLGADVTLAAELGAEASMPEDKRFHLSGHVGASATLGVEVQGGIQVGSQLAAAIGAGLFARAEAKAGVKAGISGVLVLDTAAKKLRVSEKAEEKPKLTYDASAELTAALGLTVHATALVFFKKELWRYEFKKWTLGSYKVQGEVTNGDDGSPKLEPPKAEFEGGKPQHPTIDHSKIADAQAELRKKQPIIGSGAERKKYLADLVEKYKAADEPAARHLDQAFEVATSERHGFLERNLERATHGVLTEEEILQHQAERQKMESAQEALEKARQTYREIQLVLVSAKDSAEDVLERGEVDIASIEDRIRKAAAEKDEAERGSH